MLSNLLWSWGLLCWVLRLLNCWYGVCVGWLMVLLCRSICCVLLRSCFIRKVCEWLVLRWWWSVWVLIRWVCIVSFCWRMNWFLCIWNGWMCVFLSGLIWVLWSIWGSWRCSWFSILLILLNVWCKRIIVVVCLLMWLLNFWMCCIWCVNVLCRIRNSWWNGLLCCVKVLVCGSWRCLLMCLCWWLRVFMWWVRFIGMVKCWLVLCLCLLCSWLKLFVYDGLCVFVVGVFVIMWFLLFFCLIGIMMIDICFDLYDDIFVVMWYWFVCVVIGFNLCLFVKSVYVKE